MSEYPLEGKPIVCSRCGEAMLEAWNVEHGWVCADCIKDYINDNYTIYDLTATLGIERRDVEDIDDD